MCHPLNITHIQVTFLRMRQQAVWALKQRCAPLIKLAWKWRPSPLFRLRR
jgi:hypothetical protein